MKERKKTTLHLVGIFADVGYIYSLLAFFHLCLVPVLFSAPSLTLNQVLQKLFFPSNICIHRIVFELRVTEEEEERKKMNKIDIFAFGFLGLVKG